jgi:ferrous iron transport protein A
MRLVHDKVEGKSEKTAKIQKGIITLNELKIGERARLIRVRGHGEIHKRLIDMGMVPGVVISVERIAPLGDPIDFKLRGYHLSLRKEEAKLVTVESLEKSNDAEH